MGSRQEDSVESGAQGCVRSNILRMFFTSSHILFFVLVILLHIFVLSPGRHVELGYLFRFDCKYFSGNPRMQRVLPHAPTQFYLFQDSPAKHCLSKTLWPLPAYNRQAIQGKEMLGGNMMTMDFLIIAMNVCDALQQCEHRIL